MLHIFINEKPIFLGSSDENPKIKGLKSAEYKGAPQELLNFIESFENDKFDGDALFLFSNNPKKLIKDFFNFYKLLEAAGGLVFNTEGKILAIYRRGFWDLPKGKVEKGEKIEDAALREVIEETGIQNAEIKRFLTKTYHTYYDNRKNRRVLKLSHWYEMKTKDTSLIPQTEEDIELAVWVGLEELKQKEPIFKNILEVVKAYEE